MKRTWKKFESMLLTVCMVFTMLPTVAFADGGTGSEIIAFTALAEDIASKEVETGTTFAELNLPASFEATVTTGPTFTATIKEDIPVSGWGVNPHYDEDVKGTYVFTPSLDLPAGVTLKDGVEKPTITVTIKEPDQVSGTNWSINADGLLTITTDAGMTDWYSNRYVETNGTKNYELVKTLYLGDNVTIILQDAFYNCEHLTNVINWGGVTEIGLSAFGNSGLTAIDFTGSHVQTIGNNAFLNCNTLIDLNGWGTQLVTLGDSFQDCHNLSSIAQLPASLTTINPLAFLRAGITSITVDSGNPNFSTSAGGALLNKAGDTLLIFPFGITGSYTTEDDITTIGEQAFSSTKLTTVTLPEDVDSIGESAFLGSNCLTSVIFEGTTPPTTIGTGIFLNCYALTGIYVPESSVDAYKDALPDYAEMIKITGNDVLVNTADELKTALESSIPSVINVAADIDLTEEITQGADHTLVILSDNTVTVSGSISIDNHTLTINGGGTFVCNRYGDVLKSSEGTLNLENITINVIGTSGGICVKTVNVGVGATVNLNFNYGQKMIRIDNSYILNINAGGTVKVMNYHTGAIYNEGTINVDGGTLTICEGSFSNECIYNGKYGTLKISNNGILNGTNGGGIHLKQGSYVEGVSGKFSDGGTALTNNGSITVGKEDAVISEDGLSEGIYLWNGSAFEKNKIIVSAQSHSVPVTKGEITQSLSVTAIASNNEVISYQWQKYKQNENSYIDISGATDAAYPLPTDLTVGAYKYKCVLTATGCDSYTTEEIAVTVNPAVGAQTYAVTVNGGTTSLTTAAEGVAVIIAANTPDSGKQFNKWTVEKGGVVLVSKYACTSFIMPAEPVELTAIYEDMPTSYYAVTIQNSGNGTAYTYNTTTYGVNSAEEKDLIFINAMANSGYSFKEWQVVSGGVNIPNVKYANNLFNMPANDVVLKAIFEPIPVNYTVTFDLNGGTHTGGGALTQTVASGDSATVPTVTRSGYTLTGWDKASTNVTTDLKVTAIWSDNSSSGGSSSVTGITLNKTSLSLYSNTSIKTANLTATITPTDATDKSVTWQSSNSAVATVNESGLVTAVANGTAIITVTTTDGGYATHCTVTVSSYTSGGGSSVTGITLNKTSLSLYSNTSTKTANLTATITPTDATDKSITWQSSNTSVATVDENGLVTAVANGTANITVTTTDGGYTASCTVTVSTYSSGGGSSSGGSSPANTATIKENQPNQPIIAESSVTATVGTNGIASAPISDKAVTDAIAKAQAEAAKQEKTEDGISISLNVTMPKGATALTATLSQSALDSLVSAGVTNLEINGSPVSISFDQKALTEIQKQANGNINITIAPQSQLSEMARAIIGTRPVYNITVSYGNNSTVSSFGQGGATVSIPYTPANGEVISGLYAVYVDENGNATRVEGSTYDAKSGSILFTTHHFSLYGVGYTAPSAEFTDISNHWAKESIDYVVGKGMIDGATETTFAPDTFMTRGTLVTALGKLAGEDLSSYTTSSFTDVEVGSTFQPYIEWAYNKGIIHGIGDNEFAPERAITREEIAVIIANFTNATGYTLPVEGKATAYADASSIGDYYKIAVTTMQQAGIMTGGTDNKFNPKSNATRAEVSSMLHRYIKLITE